MGTEEIGVWDDTIDSTEGENFVKKSVGYIYYLEVVFLDS